MNTEASFSPEQIAALEKVLHDGSQHASQMLSQWIGKPSIVELDSLRLLSLAEATTALGDGEQPLCCCNIQTQGDLNGVMLFAFREESGVALANLLIESEQTEETWTELTESAVLETANIVACAYLNALSNSVDQDPDVRLNALPGPPQFQREYAECLLEFALMHVSAHQDEVLLASTTFKTNDTPIDWTLLFLPDSDSARRLTLAMGAV